MDERPATYRELFAVREYVHLYGAHVLSLLGDQLAKVALAFLVFDRTNSAALSAAAFAVSYIPWVVGGPLLSSYADRLPRRAILIACDAIRAVIVASLAIPGIPVAVLIAMLFVSNVFSPPFTSARSAMMPDVLEGDKYVVGNGLDNVSNQVCQVLGFALGGPVVTLLSAQGALVVDSFTFLASGVLIATGVKHRPAAAATEGGKGLGSAVRDTASGAAYVFRNRTLRGYLLLLWLISSLAYAAEGLTAPLAEQFHGGPKTGGLLLAVGPLGLATGGIVIGRVCAPALRIRLTIPLAVASCLVLVPVMLAPPLAGVLVLLFVMGFCTSFVIPLNPLYVRAVEPAYRGRAMGVAVSGLNVTQGATMLLAGVIAESIKPTMVVGLAGLLGVLVAISLIPMWPHPILRVRSSATAGADPSGEAAA